MKKAAGKKIKITMDGPYEVTGKVPLDQAIIVSDGNGASESWEKGKTYKPEDQPYHLCRCGHSKNKPYCDGSHDDAGFCGHEHAKRPSYARHAKVQQGPAANLMDDETLCVGARFCDRGATVWGLIDKSDKTGNLEMAVQEACNCPSGRLTVVDSDGAAIEPELEPSISAIEDPARDCRGPLWVKGGIEIEGHDGEKYEVRNRATLCRCGESRNQPFCDGSHFNCSHMQGLDK